MLQMLHLTHIKKFRFCLLFEQIPFFFRPENVNVFSGNTTLFSPQIFGVAHPQYSS